MGLFVLDMSQEEPWKQLEDLRFELDQYEPGLSSRPAAVIANKIDLDESKENLLQLQQQLGPNTEVFPISGKVGITLASLLVKIKKLHDEYILKDVNKPVQ